MPWASWIVFLGWMGRQGNQKALIEEITGQLIFDVAKLRSEVDSMLQIFLVDIVARSGIQKASICNRTIRQIHTATGVRVYTRLSRAAFSISPRRSASRTSSSL
jgi:hypothetical protein